MNLATLAALVLAPVPVSAVSFTVTQLLDAVDTDPGDGFCIAALVGGCSLRAAIQETNAIRGTDEIMVPPGEYLIGLSGVFEDMGATGDFDVRDNLTITGAGIDQTVIRGSFLDRVFHVPTGALLELRDLEVRNGFAPEVNDIGGGMFVSPGDLDLQRVRIFGNFAKLGAGIYAEDGIVSIVDSEISHNFATDIGGAGGGMEVGNATLTIDRSSFHNNAAAEGEAIWAFISTVSLISTTVSDNFDSLVPDITMVNNSSLTLLSTTVEGQVLVDGSSLTMACSIVGGCLGFESMVSQGFNLFTSASGCPLHPLDLEGELDLLPLQGHSGLTPVRMPSLNSLAIDAGHPVLCASVDQWQSNPRAVDGDEDGQAVVDIGAIETPLMIFADGFESGNTNAWSDSVP